MVEFVVCFEVPQAWSFRLLWILKNKTLLLLIKSYNFPKVIFDTEVDIGFINNVSEFGPLTSGSNQKSIKAEISELWKKEDQQNVKLASFCHTVLWQNNLPGMLIDYGEQ